MRGILTSESSGEWHRRAVHFDATFLPCPRSARSVFGFSSKAGFANLGSQMIIAGTGITTTNYTDVGGATNVPARDYRVRLVP